MRALLISLLCIFAVSPDETIDTKLGQKVVPKTVGSDQYTYDQNVCLQVDIRVNGPGFDTITGTAKFAVEFGADTFTASLTGGLAFTCSLFGSVFLELTVAGTYAIPPAKLKTMSMKSLLQAVVKHEIKDPLKRFFSPPPGFDEAQKEALSKTMMMFMIPAGLTGRGGATLTKETKTMWQKITGKEGTITEMTEVDKIKFLQKETNWGEMKDLILENIKDFVITAATTLKTAGSQAYDARMEFILEIYKNKLTDDCDPSRALPPPLEMKRLLICIFLKSGIFTQTPFTPTDTSASAVAETRFPAKGSEQETEIAKGNIEALFPVLFNDDWIQSFAAQDSASQVSMILRLPCIRQFAKMAQPFADVIKLKSTDFRAFETDITSVSKKGLVSIGISTSFGTTNALPDGSMSTYGCTPDMNPFQFTVGLGVEKKKNEHVTFGPASFALSGVEPSGRFQFTVEAVLKGISRSGVSGTLSARGQMHFALNEKAVINMSEIPWATIVEGLRAALHAGGAVALALANVKPRNLESAQLLFDKVTEQYNDVYKKLKKSVKELAVLSAVGLASGLALAAATASPVTYSAAGRLTVHYFKEKGDRLRIFFSHDRQYGVSAGVGVTPTVSAYYWSGTTLVPASEADFVELKRSLRPGILAP